MCLTKHQPTQPTNDWVPLNDTLPNSVGSDQTLHAAFDLGLRCLNLYEELYKKVRNCYIGI